MTTGLPVAGRDDVVPADPAASRSRWRFPWWIGLGVVAVVALVVGSGVFRSSPPSASDRVTAIEAHLRCPSCEDLSVAQSSAPTAVAVRAVIRHQVAEGRSESQIEAYLVSRYGSTIELTPPAHGWSLLVWLVPAVGGLVALAAVARLLTRRQRQGRAGEELTGGRAERGLDAEGVAARRAFLVRSLADADAEYLVGDLSDADYLALRRRDMGRLAALETAATGGLLVADRELEEGRGSAEASAPPAVDPSGARARARPIKRPNRNHRSRWYLAGAVAAFGAALVVTVTQLSSSRAPGQTVTGNVSLSPGQQLQTTLAQAATEEDNGQVSQAASLYQRVLVAHPDNEVALAQLGWIEFEAGHPSGNKTLLSDARHKLDRAVQLEPGDYAARLYLGSLLFEQDGAPAAAVTQFRAFLADQPPGQLVTQAAPVLRAAYTAAGQPLPATVPAA